MKKIISTVTIFCFLTTILQAEYYSKKEARKTALNTILLGLGLAAIGYAPLAIEKKDITNPSLNYSKYTWNKQNYGTSNWYAAAQGVVKNTGNVPLKNVKIYIKYYDVNNNLLSSEYTYLDTYWLEPLPVNTEDTWHDIITTMLGEPHRLEVSATYEYDKIYKEESKTLSPTLGTIGVVIAGIGVLMYLFPTPTQKVMNKNFRFSVLARNGYVNFALIKSFRI